MEWSTLSRNGWPHLLCFADWTFYLYIMLASCTPSTLRLQVTMSQKPYSVWYGNLVFPPPELGPQCKPALRADDVNCFKPGRGQLRQK